MNGYHLRCPYMEMRAFLHQFELVCSILSESMIQANYAGGSETEATSSTCPVGTFHLDVESTDKVVTEARRVAQYAIEVAQTQMEGS